MFYAKIALWNNGKKTVYKSDIVANDPITISVPQNSMIILERNKIKEKPKNNLKIIEGNPGNVLTLEFDFSEQNEGFIIPFYTTTSSLNKIKISGSIIEYGDILSKKTAISLRNKWFRWLDNLDDEDFNFFLGLFIVIFGLFIFLFVSFLDLFIGLFSHTPKKFRIRVER